MQSATEHCPPPGSFQLLTPRQLPAAYAACAAGGRRSRPWFARLCLQCHAGWMGWQQRHHRDRRHSRQQAVSLKCARPRRRFHPSAHLFLDLCMRGLQCAQLSLPFCSCPHPACVLLLSCSGITWMTKDGLKKPNYFGSLTHAATVRTTAPGPAPCLQIQRSRRSRFLDGAFTSARRDGRRERGHASAISLSRTPSWLT